MKAENERQLAIYKVPSGFILENTFLFFWFYLRFFCLNLVMTNQKFEGTLTKTFYWDSLLLF